ncbi:hypothetical protein QO199_23245 [Serratia bockelmannii]|uniref:Uncharacterized protein n=1 Tax=Serratia bockelmannii TaxID=2703793 RepID=A0ABT8LYY0_9GAMM|nr:hypothetical protein [Serratia bockelmannii]MDN6881560.1 hypothetical protein [Serratia bockelmannii]HBH6890246.1 hypothetical protein [Serratia marcescens]
MGKSILISINGIPYPSKAAAVRHFMQRRDEFGTEKIESGPFFNDLKSLFVQYCECSPGWELNGRLVNHFNVKAEKRFISRNWVTTYCYEVHLSNGEQRPFSVEKAVNAIAKSDVCSFSEADH